MISKEILYEISSDDEFIGNFIGNFIRNDRVKFHTNEPSAPSYIDVQNAKLCKWLFCNMSRSFTDQHKRALITYHDAHARWRHQMETFSALLAICAGNSLVTGEFSASLRNDTRSIWRKVTQWCLLHVSYTNCSEMLLIETPRIRGVFTISFDIALDLLLRRTLWHSWNMIFTNLRD